MYKMLNKLTFVVLLYTRCCCIYSVNGSVSPESILRKGPFVEGDQIILTKGLGTGTIMAADMRAKANGSWVYGALRSMLLSNRTAAAILREHGCKAATDVTGFGFMGHLLEMANYKESSSDDADITDTADNIHDRTAPSIPSPRCNVIINVNKIPLLMGAVDCVKMGVLSSLQPQNVRSARAVGNTQSWIQDPVYPLLFDPQVRETNRNYPMK